MWSVLSIALISALLTLVGSYLLRKVEEPHPTSSKQLVVLNIVCVVAAMLFELFIDMHGPAPLGAYVVAAFEPIGFSIVLFLNRAWQTRRS